jgi:putative oxidoreductase
MKVLERYQSEVIAVFRIVVGFLFASHGAAALLCSGSMAYAYFTVHQVDALLPVQNGGEKAALFCFAFLLIAFLGNGTWSVERPTSVREKLAAATE